MKRQADIERFTQGDCHILARALHLKTGWPICAFAYGGGPDLHAFVRMPDERLLDIEGVRTVQEARHHWETKLRVAEFAWRDFRAWGGATLGRYSYARARILADRILEEVAA